MTCAVLGVMTGRVHGQTGGLVPLPSKMGDAGLEITAEKFEVDQKTGWTTASGAVKIRNGEHELNADRVRLHQEKGDVQARERFDRELDSFHRDPDAWKRSHPYDSDRKRYRYDEDDYYRHKKKKKGFDIFDIFD